MLCSMEGVGLGEGNEKAKEDEEEEEEDEEEDEEGWEVVVEVVDNEQEGLADSPDLKI